MRKVILLSGAKADLRDAFRYHEAERKGLGEKFLNDFYETRSRIIDHPFAGPVVYKNYRKARFQIFKFDIIYSPEPERILVVAVMHRRRDPDYWKTRI